MSFVSYIVFSSGPHASLRGLRRSAFLFELFCESVETEMRQERDQKRHEKRDFETWTRSISTVWLQMESDCLSIADFIQDSSALSMLTKNYKL